MIGLNKKIRRFSLLLSVCCMFCLFPSCARKGSDETPSADRNVPVFVGTRIETGLLTPCPGIEPYCRADSLTFAAYGEGGLGKATLSLNEFAISSFEPIGIGTEEECIPICGCLTENGYAILSKDGEDESLRLRTERGECGDLGSLAGERFTPFDLAVTPDENGGCGTVWLASIDRLIALDKDFSLRLDLPAESFLGPIVSDGGSGLWMLTDDGIDHLDQNGAVTERIALDGGDGAADLFRYGAENALGCVTSRGAEIYGQKGWETLIDFVRSGISSVSMQLLALVDTERAVFAQTEGETLWYYRKTDESEAADTLTLEIASFYEPDAAFKNQMIRVMRENPGLRIHVTNYSDTYADLADANAALSRDLVTGIYKPDIVWNVTDQVWRPMAEHGLTRDLSPFLDADPEINRETLFGSVLRAMDKGGEIWGLPMSMRYYTLVAMNAVLGEYAGPEYVGKTGWTLHEELDFLESLPADIEAFYGRRQDLAPVRLTGWNDFRIFIDMDTMTASFDSPDAVRFFRYISTLPVTHEELLRVSPAIAAFFSEGYEAHMDYYYNGKIALALLDFDDPMSWMSKDSLFLTDEVTMIGYPTTTPEIGGSGIIAEPEKIFAVTSYSEHPDAAWSFIRTILLGMDVSSVHGPILKSVYDKQIRSELGKTFAYYTDGSKQSFLVTEDNPIEKADPYPDKPGIRRTFDEAEAEKLREVYDSVGAPHLSGISEEVSEIVSEELSAMSAGASSPEDCAKKIQSRVSIWLAEHK
ncbi:MAG: hypothetical protein IKX20_02725 [Paludibacteraceae bacterium]|nr:hypothetical protein [Paludibacteraceae bacterium]